MIKRCIGIDIGSSHLCAVQLCRTAEQFCIEKIFSRQAQRTTDLPLDILGLLVSQYGFDRRADVAISMPYNSVFFRNLEIDSTGDEQIHRLDKSALEHNFPIKPDEIVAQVYSRRQLTSGKYSVLTAAVTQAALHERLNTLAVAKMHPDLVDAAIFAIHSTVTVNHPEITSGTAIIAYIDDSYLTLTVTQDGNILIVRNIPIASHSDNDINSVQKQITQALSREAQITWQKVFGEQGEQDSKIYLVAGCNVSNDLQTAIKENLHCQTTIVNPYAKVKCSSQCNSDTAISVAEGLALRVLSPEKTTGINFLEADNADIKPKLNLKKEFVTCAALVAAIVVVLLVGLFIRLSRLETKYTQVKNQTREVFQRTLPEEKNIVSPLVQLEQKLRLLQTDYTLFGSVLGAGVEPFEVFHTITTSIPSEIDININNMLITTESVRLTGTSQSFESVYNWQQLLQNVRQFSTVDVQNIRRASESGLIHFTISVSLATLERAAILH